MDDRPSDERLCNLGESFDTFASGNGAVLQRAIVPYQGRVAK